MRDKVLIHLEKLKEKYKQRRVSVMFGVWDKVHYNGVDYYGNPQVRVLNAAENVRKKEIMGLNNLHHAVRNALSLNNDTAPSAIDCISDMATGGRLI